MRTLGITFSQNFVMIACLLASMALALNALHVHSGSHVHGLYQTGLSAGPSTALHECAMSMRGAQGAKLRQLMCLRKPCSAAYYISDVICPAAFPQIGGVVLAHYAWNWPGLSAHAPWSFHYPP
ncbi:hypothetical protein [Rhizobium lusitanum]|uniref:DUF2946 domain-containing protein n=1 Tax=Rhizobium lusitanum TaxID=293958 RepID=A0A7X0MHK3_9HYPH|nr:hypothetical protein [Rhizobium lusitanum]MBB6489310.1 hypothetical protein [Rhizobium lusitanum]